MSHTELELFVVEVEVVENIVDFMVVFVRSLLDLDFLYFLQVLLKVY